MFRPFLLSAAALLASGCTLVTGNFTECATADDCGAGRTCVSGFCVEPGCNDVYGATDDPNAIPIGAALPLTVTGGGQDQSEVQGLNAIRLAVEEINQRQGVAGRPFALYVCDTAGDAAKIKEQVAYLIDTKKVPAVITSGSGQTLAASSITISKGALLMSATATSPELTDVSDKPGGATVGLLWRTAPSDAIQGRVIADLLTNSANATYGLNALSKIDLLYVNDVYGQGLSGVVRDRLSGKGKTVNEQFFARGATDAEIDTLVSNLDADDPDVTVVIGFPDDLTRILPKTVSKPNLMRSSGHKWLFTDAAKDPALYSDANVKAMIVDSYGTAPAQGAGSAYGTFKPRFQNRFNVDPGNFSFTSHSYDAMYLLALSSGWAIGSGSGELTGARMAEGLTQVSNGGTSYPLQPDQFTSAISKLQAQTAIDVEGASGKLNFDAATGEAPSPIEIWKVSSTGFTTIETREPPP